MNCPGKLLSQEWVVRSDAWENNWFNTAACRNDSLHKLFLWYFNVYKNFVILLKNFIKITFWDDYEYTACKDPVKKEGNCHVYAL